MPDAMTPLTLHPHEILRLASTGSVLVVRPVSPPHDHFCGPEVYEPETERPDGTLIAGPPVCGIYDPDGEWGITCHFGAPGGRLWVREAHYVARAGYDDGHDRFILYEASDEYAPVGEWTPADSMPQWASRYTVTLESVDVRRVTELSEDEAIDAGAPLADNPDHDPDDPCDDPPQTHLAGLYHDWTTRHPSHPWHRDPWAWCGVVRLER